MRATFEHGLSGKLMQGANATWSFAVCKLTGIATVAQITGMTLELHDLDMPPECNAFLTSSYQLLRKSVKVSSACASLTRSDHTVLIPCLNEPALPCRTLGG